MIYCFYGYNIGYHNGAELYYLKPKGNYCFYDNENDIFCDMYRNKVDINQKNIFPIGGCYVYEKLISKIKENGGIIAYEQDKFNIVDHWPNYVNTKRKVKVLKGKDLINDDILDKLEKEMGKKIFFKTLIKGYSEFVDISTFKNHDSILYHALKLHEEDEFIVSEIVNINNDELGRREYRTFVVNGNILNISRCFHRTLHSIDKYVYKKIKEIVEKLIKTNFPKSFTLDVFEYQKDGENLIDILEFNPLSGSGKYLYNSFMDLNRNDDILHKNIYNVAPEKKSLLLFTSSPIYGDINERKIMKTSKYFCQENSFSADLEYLYKEGLINNDTDFDLNKIADKKIVDSIKSKKDKPNVPKIETPIEKLRKEWNIKIVKERIEHFKKENRCPLFMEYLIGGEGKLFYTAGDDNNLGISENTGITHFKFNNSQDELEEFMKVNDFIEYELKDLLKQNNILMDYDKFNYGDTELVYVLDDGIKKYTLLINQPQTSNKIIEKEAQNLNYFGEKHSQIVKPVTFLKGSEKRAYVTPYYYQARCIATKYNWGVYVPEPEYRFEEFSEKDKSTVHRAMIAYLINLYDQEREIGISNCKLGGGDFILKKKWDFTEHSIKNTLNNMHLIAARDTINTSLNNYIDIIKNEFSIATKIFFTKEEVAATINIKNTISFSDEDIEKGIALGLSLRKYNSGL